MQDQFLGPVVEGKEDTVLNRTCKMHALSRMAAVCMDNSSCAWDNKGGVPEVIIARGHLHLGGGNSISSTVQSLDLNVSVPLTTLRPPMPWLKTCRCLFKIKQHKTTMA